MANGQTKRVTVSILYENYIIFNTQMNRAAVRIIYPWNSSRISSETIDLLRYVDVNIVAQVSLSMSMDMTR